MNVVAIAQESEDVESEAIATFNKGQDAHEAGDLKAAIELYEKALKLVPDFPEAELQRGKAYRSLGNLETAEVAFRRAVSLKEDWSLALANLGDVLVRRNKFDEARPILKHAIEVDSENTPAYVALSALTINSKASESEIREIYKKISAMADAAKGVASVWSAKAALENAMGEKRSALTSANKALELDPKNISMRSLIASMALESADPTQARSQIAAIEKIEPTAPELAILRIRLLIFDGKNDEAAKAINAIKEPSKDILDLKTQIAAATSTDVPALEKKLADDPKNATALGRLCSLQRTKDPLKAMEYCRRANEIDPTNIDFAIGYGAAMLQAKQYLQAATLFQKLQTTSPENFTLRVNLATALFQLKRYNEAKVQFQWITGKQPENVIAYYFLAIAHDELSEYGDAMANYQIFLRKADPKTNQLEIDKVNLRLPILQRQLDAGKGRKNAKAKG
jgi:tetratricopeptide (TPR) repeat protein